MRYADAPQRTPDHGAGMPRDAARPTRAAGPAGLTQAALRGAAMSMPFPHAARIAAALGGGHRFEAWHAPDACRARGTRAFTDGATSLFADRDPGLHVAAHEAAHQLQHAGVTRDLGLGAEPHANLVADRIVGGGDAASALGRAGAPVPATIRHYTETDDNGVVATTGLHKGRLSDDGEALVADAPSKLAYATAQRIEASNAFFKRQKSELTLSAGAERRPSRRPGTAPRASCRGSCRVSPGAATNSTPTVAKRRTP